MNLLDKPGGTAYDSWRVPENEVYEAMQTLRRKLTTWLRESATQREVCRAHSLSSFHPPHLLPATPA